MNITDFYEHFKTLASDINQTVHPEIDDFLTDFDGNPPAESTFPELDFPITRSEILASIKKLKRNKAFGPDSLLNEYFIESAGLLLERLELYLIKFLVDHFRQYGLRE